MQYESFHLELDANVMFLFAQQNMFMHPYMYPVTTTSCVYKPINANALIKKSSSFYILKFDRQGNFLQQAGKEMTFVYRKTLLKL